MTVLHGREIPIRTLRDALAAANGSRGQVVLLVGEAGIGKSALGEALAADALAAGAAVTWGRAWEFAEAPAYFPMRPCMRSLGVEVTDDDRSFELWEDVLAALAHRAQTETVVWIVEDIHAADLGTLDLLTYLAQPLRAMRVLVVATLRSHDPRLDDRKLQRLARIARDGVEIRLEPLEGRAIAAIAEDTLGRAMPDHALPRFAELTGGNPLFAVECARAVRAGGIDRILTQLPPTVRHVVSERVALLPEATRRLLDAGAVLGRELSAATVARMMESDIARVIDELLPALRAGVLREVRSGHFTFSHVVVRDAVEDAIPAEQRARLHAAAEEALRELGDHAEIVVERARHALAGASLRDPRHVLDLARRATDLLERERAFDRAFELHAKIAEARAAGVLPMASSDDKLRFARVARDHGRSDVMQRLCDDVIDTARASEEFVLFADAVLLHATSIRVGVIDGRQVALLEEARAKLAPDSPDGCRVLARLATALQPADDNSITNDLSRTALRDARAVGDDALIIEVLDLGAFGMWGAPRDERIAWSEELRDRALRAGDAPRVISACSCLALWHTEAGDHAKLSAACAQALACVDRVAPRHRWDALLLASGYACAHGNFAESDRHIAEVNQISALVDDPALAVAQVFHAIERATIRRRQDDFHAALAKLAPVVRDIKYGALHSATMRASSYARFGDLEATRAELAQIGTQLRLLEVDLESMAMLAEAYALVGSDDDRRWIRERLCASGTSEFFSIRLGYMYEGTIDRLVGLLDAALGDLESAERRLRGAHALATERRLRPWIAQTAHELAQIVALRGGDSRILVEEAAALGRELGIAGYGGLPVPADVAPAAVRVTRTADVWTIERGRLLARVKDSRGMQLLARLLERPGEEMHVLALASDQASAAPESSAGEMLDERARSAYRQRIAQLDEAIERAEQRGDERASLRHEAEKAALVHELTRATGIGGRGRVAGSGTERARVNVQRRLKDAIARIAEADREIGLFLEGAVRTGTYCSFQP